VYNNNVSIEIKKMNKIKLSFLLILLLAIYYSGNALSEPLDEGDSVQISNTLSEPLDEGDSVQISNTLSEPPSEKGKTKLPPKEGLDPALEKELRNIGIPPEMLVRNPYNFYDGDFEITGKITRAIMENKLFQNNQSYREEIKKNITNSTTLFFPWDSAGKVKLIRINNNALAELYRKGDEGVSVSQYIAFKKKEASLEFDLEVVKADSNDTLQVLLHLPPEGKKPERQIVLANYTLFQLSQNNHLVINLSRNKLFIDELKELDRLKREYEYFLNVAFYLAPSKNKQSNAIIRLDNIKITYRD
jgi:hypothetical protein